MQSTSKMAVAGATGRVGHHVVDILRGRGHEVVEISRAKGVDLVTGEGLDEALAGVEVVVDAASGPSPEQEPATAFFEAATRNLQEAGRRAGVRLIVVVSIIGLERTSGTAYAAAKLAHERAMLAGPIPVKILRASQFHELVEQLVQWGTQDGVARVPLMRTQLVAARTVAEALANLAEGADGPAEIAGPQPEELVEMAELLAARRLNGLRVEGVRDPGPDGEGYATGILLPGPETALAGPTFAEWLR